MKRAEAVNRIQGKYAVVSTMTWGSYLVGPVEIVGERRWRARGPILRCVGFADDGKPFLKEGDHLEVGGANVHEDTICDTIPASYGGSYASSVRDLVERSAHALLKSFAAEQEAAQKAIEDPNGILMLDVSFQNKCMTRRGLALTNIISRVLHLLREESSLRATTEKMQARGVLVGTTPSMAAMNTSFSERNRWFKWVQTVDRGPIVFV